MLNELKQESNLTNTLNGCTAYFSSGSECLDLFALAGALRDAKKERIENMFVRAYSEDPDTAMKIIFYARDIRGGMGERRFFREAIRCAAVRYPWSVIKNIPYIAEYGRFDDLWELLSTPCEQALSEYLKKQLSQDIQNMSYGKPISLLAKWMPSVNTSNESACLKAYQIRKLLGISEKKYRKTLVALRSYIDVLEKRLCKKDYTFNYDKQPSKALYNYRKAFFRNDNERYNIFLNSVAKGESILHTSSLYPYDIVRKCIGNIDPEEIEMLDMTWKELPSYDNGQNSIAVIDGSGSMYWNYYSSVVPISVAISLGIYFAEHSTGAFANHFITFSANPRLIELKGKNIYEKVQYCMSYNEVSNTNIEKVFLLILETALKNHLKQSELPDTIYIVSDMEFDRQSGSSKTAFENAKELYEKNGYKLPTVIFWNVNSKTEQFPVRKNDTGTMLVSGANPSIFKMVIGKDLDPQKYMYSVLNVERYKNIHS